MMEAVFTVQRPIGLASALVLDSPHSRKTFPDDFGAAVNITQLRTAEDLFVNELWSRAPDHGAALLEAQFPRSCIDPNRGAGDIDLELLDVAWPDHYPPSGTGRLGKALNLSACFRRLSSAGTAFRSS
ncbi:MAG: hypothetical protein EBT08_11075 [Betaproteobacteria bacterium]|nr:hypothetical protein [Betaproteobacteria bacterium]